MANMTKFQTTQVAIYLALNFEINDDRRGATFAAWPLLSLTRLALWAWQVRGKLEDWRRGWNRLLAQFNPIPAVYFAG